MPRGKRTVYAGNCTECNARTGTVRILKRNKADFPELKKYCANCRKRTVMKVKEERHSK